MVRNPTRFRRGLGFSRVVKMKSMRHWTCRGTGRKSLGTSTILDVNSESSRFQGSAGACPTWNALPELTMPVTFLILMVQVLCGFSTNMLRDEAAL